MVASIGVLILLLLGGAYMFVRRKVKAAKKPINQKELFHPKDTDESDSDDEDIDPQAAIPPELAEAAKEYRQEHGIIESHENPH